MSGSEQVVADSQSDMNPYGDEELNSRYQFRMLLDTHNINTELYEVLWECYELYDMLTELDEDTQAENLMTIETTLVTLRDKNYITEEQYDALKASFESVEE